MLAKILSTVLNEGGESKHLGLVQFQRELLSLPSFDVLCFHFHSVLYCLTISYLSSFLTHHLSGTMLFSGQVFGHFPIIILLLISNLFPPW